MNADRLAENDANQHPSIRCYSCLDYLDYREGIKPRLPEVLAAKARREKRPGAEVFLEFMHAAHQRHLDGQSLRPDGPTRVTDPYLGRLAALMALGAGMAVDGGGADA